MDGFPSAGDEVGRKTVDDDVTLAGVIAIGHGKVNKVASAKHVQFTKPLPKHVARRGARQTLEQHLHAKITAKLYDEVFAKRSRGSAAWHRSRQRDSCRGDGRRGCRTCAGRKGREAHQRTMRARRLTFPVFGDDAYLHGLWVARPYHDAAVEPDYASYPNDRMAAGHEQGNPP